MEDKRKICREYKCTAVCDITASMKAWKVAITIAKDRPLNIAANIPGNMRRVHALLAITMLGITRGHDGFGGNDFQVILDLLEIIYVLWTAIGPQIVIWVTFYSHSPDTYKSREISELRSLSYGTLLSAPALGHSKRGARRQMARQRVPYYGFQCKIKL